jgi:uncharacterized protein (DUF433 family)
MSAKLQPVRTAIPPCEEWKYLEARSDSGRKGLFIKGRRLPAGVVWSQMQANEQTREQAALNWELPVEAIDEVIRYCTSCWEHVAADIDEDRRLAAEKGIALEPPAPR